MVNDTRSKVPESWQEFEKNNHLSWFGLPRLDLQRLLAEPGMTDLEKAAEFFSRLN